MDVVVVFFSQTGNTRKVAETLGDTFRREGHSAKIISLMDADPSVIRAADLLGFGTPCFSSQAPQPIMGFIKSLPSMLHKSAFIFATCGGAPGRVLLDMRSGLRRKGAEVIGGFLSRGEVHHPSPVLLGRFPGRPNLEDQDQARYFARNLCTQISGNVSVISSDLASINPRGFYQLLGTATSDAYLRFILPEPKLIHQYCDRCGFCAELCPNQNIKLTPYPVLEGNCIRCYQCHNICYNRAFKANWHFSSPLLWLLYHPFLIRWFGDLKPGEQIYEREKK